MANKKISELTTRTPSLSDLILVGDPSNGFSYKCTVTALATIIETDISDGYVTLGTTQTISGAKTFSNNLTLTSVANATTDPDKFLVLNGSNVVNYRTGSEVLSDIGGQATISLTTTGTSGAATFTSNTLNIPQYQGAITLTTTGTSGAATLVGNTLNIPNYAPDLSGYVPTSRTITINGTTQDLTANRTYNVGTVTSVAASGGTGISISGSPITSSGTITITNTAPDQVVALTAGTGISISGTYPNFTITNSSPSLGGTVTSVALSAPTGFAVTGSPITSSGTLALAFDTGYSLPTTASQTNWDSAYNNMIVSAAVTGTTTKTLTLTQQDAGTITASWTDDNTDAVTSVFGRTGAVVATEGDYSLTQLSDVTITSPTTGQVLKYNGTIWVNDTDANTGTVTSVALSAPTGFSVSGSPITSSGTLALSFASGYSLPTNTSQSNWDTAYTNRITSLTTTGSSGSATLISNTLNIPTYTLAGLGGISLTSLSAVQPLSYNNGTGAFSISQSNTSTDGYLSFTDWNTFNGKIGGSGTTSYVPKFTSSTAIGDSQIYDNGTSVGINTASPNEKLEVSGKFRVSKTTSSSIYLNITAEGSGNEIIFDARGSSDQVFYTQTLERLRIGLGGDITISTIANATIDTDKFLVSDSGVIKYRTGSEILSDIGGQGALTLTTTGTSGAATLVGNTLNIPQYSGGGGTVSGTTNYIAKFTSSTAVGNSQLFDDGTNVGIGTTSPSKLLDLYGTNPDLRLNKSTNGAMTIDFAITGSQIGFISSNSSSGEQRYAIGPSGGWGGFHTFYTDASERMRLTSGGSLGIGTATIGSTLQVNGNAAIGYSASTAAPTNGLAVAGAATFGASAAAVSISNASDLWYNVTRGSSFTNVGVDATGSFYNTNTNHRFLTQNGVVTALTITSGGNVGLGTATIGSRLQVNGNAAIGYSASTAAPTNGVTISGDLLVGTGQGSSDSRIEIGASRTANGNAYIDFIADNTTYTDYGFRILRNSGANGITLILTRGTGNFQIGTNEAAPIVFSTTAIERMRLDASGNLGIGTTTIGSKLQVNGNAAIGYSASTAAPTNGLAVAGQSTFADNISYTNNRNAGNVVSITNTNNNALSDVSLQLNSSGSGTVILGKYSQSSPTYKILGASDGFLYNRNIGDIVIFNDFATGNIRFGAGGTSTTQMTLTSGGQVTLATGSNVSAIAQTGYSLTGANAQSLIDLAGTWNTTGNPAAIKLNITNTASGASAYLMDLQVGGATQFRVTKAGAIRTAAPSGGTANDWKLGSLVTGTVCGTTNDWLEVEVGGTVYKLALALTSC